MYDLMKKIRWLEEEAGESPLDEKYIPEYSDKKEYLSYLAESITPVYPAWMQDNCFSTGSIGFFNNQ